MNSLHRRAFMAACSSLGLGSTLFPGVLWGLTQQPQRPPATTPPAGTPQGRGESAAESAKEAPKSPAPNAITKESVREAAKVAGLHFEDAQIEMMVKDLGDRVKQFEQVWELKLSNDVAPAL